MKIELTKEQAKNVIECAIDHDGDNCKTCVHNISGECCKGFDDCHEYVKDAARVLYGTKQKLDRVEIAKDFMGSMLSNDIIEIGKSNHEGIVKISFMYADAFINEAGKEKTK